MKSLAFWANVTENEALPCFGRLAIRARAFCPTSAQTRSSARHVYIAPVSTLGYLYCTTADDYNSKVLSERGGAGQRVGYTKIGPRASPLQRGRIKLICKIDGCSAAHFM